MAITTLADVRARCTVDPTAHCWIWTGATSAKRQPVMHAFDHDRGEKRTMTGNRAVWGIAFGRAPRPGHLIHRACGNCMCLNPAHLREARDHADIGLHIRRAGSRVGTALESRRQNIRAAHRAQGIVCTPVEVVQAIRSASPDVTGRALAQLHAISVSTVSRIRRGESNGAAA